MVLIISASFLYCLVSGFAYYFFTEIIFLGRPNADQQLGTVLGSIFWPFFLPTSFVAKICKDRRDRVIKKKNQKRQEEKEREAQFQAFLKEHGLWEDYLRTQ